jgi:hypothetical protein
MTALFLLRPEDFLHARGFWFPSGKCLADYLPGTGNLFFPHCKNPDWSASMY